MSTTFTIRSWCLVEEERTHNPSKWALGLWERILVAALTGCCCVYNKVYSYPIHYLLPFFLKKNKHNYKRLRPPRVITLNLLPRVFKTAITRITDALHQQWLHKDPAVPTQLWRNSPSIYSVRIRKQVTAAKDFSSLSLQFSVLCCLLLTSSLFDLVHSSSKWRRPLRRERRRKKNLIR